MSYQLKLTVDQVIAAITLLDDEEQAHLRMQLIAWLAGVGPPGVGPELAHAAGRISLAEPARMLPTWLAADPFEDDELCLFDELMALGDE